MISRTTHPNYTCLCGFGFEATNHRCPVHGHLIERERPPQTTTGGETRMMTDNAYMTYTNPQYDWISFRWWGGEYIEIGSEINGEWVAGDVINVWDHAKGEPRIPRSLNALEACCDEWLERPR